MTFSIMRTYRFEAAHFLPLVPDTHKCKRVHGHNYRIDVTVSGPLDERGFVLDFFELDAKVSPLVEQLDHRCLNEIEGIENPTAEIIAKWFADGIAWPCTIRVFETPDACAEYAAP
jgi:6-pyruvoyltetrahydropterin/6-carboxytetrahydropterin synthase